MSIFPKLLTKLDARKNESRTILKNLKINKHKSRYHE